MAGHSKWANIKHRKGAQDKKRGKIFTKILKEITVAAKEGGGDPSGNPRLRLAVEKAKGANVPKDNIERAIKRGTGELEGVNYEDYTYEGYGPGGVAILVNVLTDNKNRTGGEVRSIFTKHNGNLAEPGAVSWIFERKGLIVIEGANEDEVMEVALENGAEDVEAEDQFINVYSSAEDYETLKTALEKDFNITNSEVTMIPQNSVKIDDENIAATLLKLLDKLDDNDDVNQVYANFDMDEKMLEAAQ